MSDLVSASSGEGVLASTHDFAASAEGAAAASQASAGNTFGNALNAGSAPGTRPGVSKYAPMALPTLSLSVPSAARVGYPQPALGAGASSHPSPALPSFGPTLYSMGLSPADPGASFNAAAGYAGLPRGADELLRTYGVPTFTPAGLGMDPSAGVGGSPGGQNPLNRMRMGSMGMGMAAYAAGGGMNVPVAPGTAHAGMSPNSLPMYLSTRGGLTPATMNSMLMPPAPGAGALPPPDKMVSGGAGMDTPGGGSASNLAAPAGGMPVTFFGDLGMTPTFRSPQVEDASMGMETRATNSPMYSPTLSPFDRVTGGASAAGAPTSAARFRSSSGLPSAASGGASMTLPAPGKRSASGVSSANMPPPPAQHPSRSAPDSHARSVVGMREYAEEEGGDAGDGLMLSSPPTSAALGVPVPGGAVSGPSASSNHPSSASTSSAAAAAALASRRAGLRAARQRPSWMSSNSANVDSNTPSSPTSDSDYRPSDSRRRRRTSDGLMPERPVDDLLAAAIPTSGGPVAVADIAAIQTHMPTGNSSAAARALPPTAIAVLKAWLLSPEHFEHPYPTDPQKEALAAQCNISVRQVSVWFTNARKRIWLPLRQKQARMRNKRAKAGDATSMGASHEGHATAFEDAEQGDEHGHDLEHDGSEGAFGAGDAGGETAGAGTSAGSNANGIAHARGNVGAVGAASVASSVRGGGGGGSVAREASAGTPASTVSDSTTQNGVRKSASPDDREGALHLAALASAAVSAARADDLLYLPGEADSFSAARSSRKTESSRQSATSHAMHSNTPTTSSDMSNTASSTPQSGSDPYTTEANNLRAAHHDRSRSMAGSRGGWTGSNYTGVSPLHTASPRVEALLMGAAAVDAATGGAAAARSGFPDLLSGSLSAHMHPRVQALSPSMAPPHFPYALSVITPQYVLGLLEGVDEQSAAVRLAAVAGAVAINRKELEAEAAHLRALEAVIAEAHQRLLSARLKNMRSGAQ